MRFHIYGNKCIYNENNVELIINIYQLEILKLYIQYKSIDKVIEIITRDIDISPNDYIAIEKNISTLIFNVENKINKALNKVIEIKTSGEKNKFYPRVLNIELCDSCNFYCGHCYKEAGGNKNNYLSLHIIDEICELFSGQIQVIHLTGGEPLLHPNINQILEKLINSDFIVNITTNGSKFHVLEKRFIEKINNFQISLYGYNRDTYKLITNADYFDDVDDFFDYLKYKNIKFDIGLVLNKIYLDNNEQLIEYIRNTYCNKLIMSFPSYAGRLTSESINNKIWNLNNNDKRKLVHLLKSIKIENNVSSLEKDLNSGESNYLEKCYAGTLSYSIDEKGNVGLCQALSSSIYKIGNLYDLYARCQNNSFDIVNEMNTIGLSKYTNPMCKYYRGK